MVAQAQPQNFHHGFLLSLLVAASVCSWRLSASVAGAGVSATGDAGSSWGGSCGVSVMACILGLHPTGWVQRGMANRAVPDHRPEASSDYRVTDKGLRSPPLSE